MRHQHPTPALRQREAAATGGAGAAPPAATLDAPPPAACPLPAVYILTTGMHIYKFLGPFGYQRTQIIPIQYLVVFIVSIMCLNHHCSNT